MEFARFSGLPPIRRSYNATDISDAVCQILIDARVDLVLVDEIHNLNLATSAGEDMSDHLKYFTEHLPATFVYAGINVEFRTEPPLDFAQYAEVDIGGPDPNGLGLLGYDNTPGKDVGNSRLYDRIGGVNAATQGDGFPGYGGVFSDNFLGFSAH